MLVVYVAVHPTSLVAIFLGLLGRPPYDLRSVFLPCFLCVRALCSYVWDHTLRTT